MLWHVMVRPDCARAGVGRQLLRLAVQEARARGIVRIEAWTRDDDWVNAWYLAQGFTLQHEYHHAYVDDLTAIAPDGGARLLHGVRLASAFVHVTDVGLAHTLREAGARVHACRRYDLMLDAD